MFSEENLDVDKQNAIHYEGVQIVKNAGITLVDVQRDYAEAIAKVGPENLNARLRAHGGLYFTMADTIVGTCARTDGRMYVTQSASVNFLREATSGIIRGKTRLIKRGRTVCTVEANIYNEEDTLLFTGIFVMFCIS